MHDVTLAADFPLENAHVVELVSSISPESFGLGYAALNLAAALNRIGTNVFLVCVDQEKHANEACEQAGFPREKLIRGSLKGPSRLRFSPFLLSRLSGIQGNSKTIVHMHGIWTYLSYVAGALRERWKCPLVLSPHGSLDSAALAISPLKKALASKLYERRNLMTASCMCALSKQEEASIRAYGYAGRVKVLPNGVNRAVACSAEEVAGFRARHDIAPGLRVLLFLSRISPQKNLALLVKSFAKNVESVPGWVLVIAGSDEGGHTREVLKLIRELRIEKSVRMIGRILGKEKACAFTAAAVFALPSPAEGLPISVLEAMEYGKPVLVTDGWTLPVMTSAIFGWRVAANEGMFGLALHDAMNKSDDELETMGRAGRALVRENFEWDSIARQATSLYASVLTPHNTVDN